MERFTIDDLGEFEVLQTIVLPLIVPTWEEVQNSKDLSFLSTSDLNACYSKPRENEKGEKNSWYEVEITVHEKHDLPRRKDWFYVVTDEDWFFFKARFEGRKVKKLCSFVDREALGWWIKYRLTEEDLIDKFLCASDDKRRWGVVTKETLYHYGGDKLILKKTNKTRKDKSGKERDVWVLSFPYDFEGMPLPWELWEKYDNK
ncbi:restriction endonuclease PLD domain-containing protein [Mycoplasma wenyonii]|uniref:restriction endonuclease PLD domain-containing protein n=1 Tax=Mycoplasma wenyonii TaxID=65123 RepID=UPI0002F7DC82|nr:restriction endonuclease PLD domain-containing protein [Mycoplasma wenyonii]